MILAPEELRRRQLAALSNWVMAGAKVQPVVLAFEDLHWADPTTLDVLRGIAERGALAPLFIVATTRPEFRPPWGMRSHHGTISLAPLDRAQVRDMVAELSARQALPKDVVEDVAARTGGVPLFVEEVTRLLLERGEQGGGIEAIPPTLQQSLMARLDRLGPAREVAQVGAVIGRDFSYALIRAVAGTGEAPLQTALERLAEADIVLVQGLPPDSDYRFKHALIQDAAYENLLKSRRQVLHRRVAEILRDRFADTAAAEPEALAYHFTQAGMTDAAIEWWGKAGDQALRRSAFQEAISHLGKAIEMADKAGESPTARAAAATTSAGHRARLQTSYGRALMWSKGFVGEETKAAFNRARELAANSDDADERFTAYYGLWLGSFSRGELVQARTTAETFKREAESAARMTEAGISRRFLGLTYFAQGDFTEAEATLVEALKHYDPERDEEAKFRFGIDTGFGATLYLAPINWVLGDVGKARKLIEEALARALESAHVPTLTNAYAYTAMLETLRGDVEAALRAAENLIGLSREHGMATFLNWGLLLSGWARARLGDREAGTTQLRRALAAKRDQENRAWDPFYRSLLAEIEAEGEGAERALARIDEALALAGETGEHWTDALLHRIRGEILLRRDLANTAPAEEAFLTAIAVAQEQKARSFELRAALALAKLYQASSRPADAHAILAPALEGFSPTPEFPEIVEAQTLVGALATTDEVKNTAASRQRRLRLQTSYGHAVAWSRGFGVEETKTAFTRAQELATGIDSADERFATYYGVWVGSLLRGELRSARETAETFRREAESGARTNEVAVACRYLGLTCLCQGDFVEAQTNLVEALRVYDPERDREAKFRFGIDTGAGARAYLANVSWLLGDLGKARELIEEAGARAVQSGHVPTQTTVYYQTVLFEMLRGDAEATQRTAEALVQLSQEHSMALYLTGGALACAWARARRGDRERGATDLRQALAAHADTGNKLHVPYFQGLLAELEAEAGSKEAALSRIDEALALAGKTEERWSDAFLYRIRGEILLKRDPANPAPAEEAFLTAIAIAQQQRARSFGLRAARALAKLYQSTNRAADARAALAPALEGFARTSEFPEIEETQALLAALRP